MPSDHPQLAFIQAAGYTKGRPDGPPLWIVIHDMEAGERSDTAENTARYFANPSDGRSVSAHYCWDNTSGVQCVRLHDCAWTVGNRPGNNRGINHELAGFARQTREQWLDQFGLAMFRQAAPIIRADAARFAIPLERRTVAELKAFKPGITSHNDLRLAFGGTTHTDPGPNFPWDVFLSIIKEDEMDAAQDAAVIAGKLSPRNVLHFRLRAIQDSQDPLLAEVYPPEFLTHLPPGLRQIGERLAALERVVTDEQLERVLRKILGSLGE